MVSASSTKHTCRSLIASVLSDGEEKTVCDITKHAAKLVGQRQHKPTIHAECVKMKKAGLVVRTNPGVYKAV